MSNYNANFSECRRYRYTWSHRWAEGKCVQFIGLNPSTADENVSDPTIRRCTRFAKDWGYAGIVMTNLFAFRATDPNVMKTAQDPVGAHNDDWLQRIANDAGVVVAAWGTHGSHLNRDSHVRRLLSKLHCLRLTKEGFPGHPLYLPANLTPQPWEVA